MPSLETPPKSATPTQPVKVRTGRYGELEEHELIHLLDSLDDERSKARFRESIYISIIIYMGIVWFLFYGPRVLFHQPRLISPVDVLKEREKQLTFLDNLPSTQGMLFTGSYFYYQDHTKILRVPYKPGDLATSGASEQVADITIYTSSLHWPTVTVSTTTTCASARRSPTSHFRTMPQSTRRALRDRRVLPTPRPAAVTVGCSVVAELRSRSPRSELPR